MLLNIGLGGRHVMFFLPTLVIFEATKTRGFLGVAEELLSMKWKQFRLNFPGFIYYCIFRSKDKLAFTSNLVE